MFVFVNNGQIMEKSISIQYKLNNLGSERNETERERENSDLNRLFENWKYFVINSLSGTIINIHFFVVDFASL